MKKQRLLVVISLLASLVLFQSCDFIFDVATNVLQDTGIMPQDNSTGTLKSRAYRNAVDFMSEETKYQDCGIGRTVYPFDCSGFVARCYYDASLGSAEKLYFDLNYDRPTVSSLFERYTKRINELQLQRGDLIFIDYSKDPGQRGTYPDHVGIFKELKGGYIYFIDSSTFQASYNPPHSVKTRRIQQNDRRIMGYGEMLYR